MEVHLLALRSDDAVLASSRWKRAFVRIEDGNREACYELLVGSYIVEQDLVDFLQSVRLDI